jgi:repressor LexA
MTTDHPSDLPVQHTLTERQSEILQFIQQTLAERGAPPTREEIARAFGFRSLNAAEQHLQALHKKGVIELVSGTSRGIRLRNAARALTGALTNQSLGTSAGALSDAVASFIGLPLIGKVAAGSPILAQENVLRHPHIDPDMFKPRADYLLEVRGMSMRDVGILDGDWLAVHRQSQAHNGQIVVARLGDDVTVKRLKQQGSTLELIAENPDYRPIVVDLTQEPVTIEGIAVGVIRPTV